MTRRNRRSAERSEAITTVPVEKPKDERKEVRYEYKVSRTDAKADLQRAKASKWKWLAILIGLLMAGFAMFKSKLIGV